MAPVQSGLYRATHVEAYHFPKTGENPFGIKFPGDASSNSSPEGYKGGGTLRDSRRDKKYIEVRIDKANEILGMDNFSLHPFCVSAYYPGESDEVINARKTKMVPAKKSAPGSRREDCFFFETIRVPYNPRQQLLHVEIFEVQVPLQMELEDEWVGRATVQLADPKVNQPTEYELTRGPLEYGGTVTVSVKLPPPEVETHPLPELREFPEPVSPRQYVKSKAMDAGGIDMSPFDIPRKSSGTGGIDVTPLDAPRTRSGSRSSEGKSPPRPIWVPVINGPGGSGFGLTPQIDKIAFQPGQDLKGSMSPLPSFGPQWFTAKLPGSLAPRPLPDCAFHLPPAPPGLIAQMPELATVPPGVAAMVAKALRAPPLTTPTMPPPPPSVLALPVRCGRASMVPPCCGGPWIPSRVAPVSVAPAVYGRNLCRVAC